MKFITSFNPKGRIERQQRCLQSWQQYNLPVTAVQHPTETQCEELFPGVDYIYTNEYNYFFDSTNPSISSLLAECPGIIINSDIHLTWTQDRFNDLLSQAPVIGIRTEEGKLNPWGLDVFILPQVSLPENPYVVGQPGWDYWLTIELVKRLQVVVCKDGIVHAPHNDRWNKTKLITAQALLTALYYQPSAQITKYVQQITDRL